jgi:hypothetical protein
MCSNQFCAGWDHRDFARLWISHFGVAACDSCPPSVVRIFGERRIGFANKTKVMRAAAAAACKPALVVAFVNHQLGFSEEFP